MKKVLYGLLCIVLVTLCLVLYQYRFLLFINGKNVVFETQETDIDCKITFDFQEIGRLKGERFVLANGQTLKITSVKRVGELEYELMFQTIGNVDTKHASLISPIVPIYSENGNIGMQVSELLIEPADKYEGFYSFKTTELNSKGNRFRITIYSLDPEEIVSNQVSISFLQLGKVVASIP